jgi:hypothetical protein
MGVAPAGPQGEGAVLLALHIKPLPGGGHKAINFSCLF